MPRSGDFFDDFEERLNELIREEEDVELTPREMQAIVTRACRRVGTDPKLAIELLRFRSTLMEETDRGCALTAGAYLDELLRSLIRCFLVKDESVTNELFSPAGPISSFSAGIDLAYSMGLISPETSSRLHVIRRIRNEFAHDAGEVKFTRDAIKSRCAPLPRFFCVYVPVRPRMGTQGNQWFARGNRHVQIRRSPSRTGTERGQS